MASWYKGISDALNKRACRFLLHRYLGQFLREKVSLDQLSVDLFNGIGSICDVVVDAEYVNECFESASLPFCMVDGFIGAIRVSVPWSKLLEESCSLEISGLEVTLQPKSRVCSDMMTSMFESMVGSMTTSLDLAKSFLNEENGGKPAESTPSNEPMEGVEAFAHMIDSVLSRMRVTFKDVVIRLEHYVDDNSHIGTALELTIDSVEYFDESLESQESSSNVITQQPNSVYSLPDVNKLIHIKGLQLFTDIFRRPINSLYTSISSMRRHPNAQSMHPSSSYIDQSPEIFMSPGLAEGDLLSKPIPFLKFASKRQTVKLKVKNSPFVDDGGHVKVEVEVYLGGGFALLTPTQLRLVTDILTSLLPGDKPTGSLGKVSSQGGKPMKPGDFKRIESELQKEIDPNMIWKTDLNTGNWSGEERFYSFNNPNADGLRKISAPGGAKPVGGSSSLLSQMEQDRFTSISMTSDGASVADGMMRNAISPKISNASSERKISRGTFENPEMTMCKLQLSSFCCIVTNDDPFSNQNQSLEAAITQLSEFAGTFFRGMSDITIGAGTDLVELRSVFSRHCPKDHLSFIGCPLVVKYIQHRYGDCRSDAVQLNVSSGNCELTECLPDPEKRVPTYVQLLMFSADEVAEESNLQIKINGDGSAYSVECHLGPCFSELDLSIVDRLHNLIHCRPSFLEKSTPTKMRSLFDVPSDNHFGLREDLFDNLDEDRGPSKVTPFVVFSPKWTVSLRFPIPDLRAVEIGVPWWVRNVRPETLDLCMTDALCRFDITDQMEQSGEVMLTSNSITGTFKSPSFTKDIDAFMFACGIGTSQCSLSFKYNFQNRTLWMDNQIPAGGSNDDSLSPGGSSKYFQVPTQDCGPFSSRNVVHEQENLTIVGDSCELKDFSAKCRCNTEILLTLTLPDLKMCLPSKEFYELLYNRLVNDLAMWEPSAPPSGHQQNLNNIDVNNYSVHIAGLKNGGQQKEQFLLCKSTMKHRDSVSDSEDDDTIKSGCFAAKKSSNELVIDLRVKKANIMLQTASLNEDSVGQLALHTGPIDLFLVTAYEGNKDILYFYVTGETFDGYHAGCVPKATSNNEVVNVMSQKFATADHLKCIMIDTPEGVSLNRSVDHNFAVAFQVNKRAKDNLKEIKVGVGVRNTTFIYSVTRPLESWIMQLIGFFDVVDYPVLGYTPPRIKTELHLHGWFCSVEYKPEEFTSAMRVNINSFDVSSNIVDHSKTVRLNFIMEDLSLFLYDLAKAVDRQPTIEDLVCIARMGLFELTVMVTEHQEKLAVRVCPSLEISARNDQLEIRCCADSAALLTKILIQLATEQEKVTEEKVTDVPSVNTTEVNGTVPLVKTDPTTNGIHVRQDTSEELSSVEQQLADLMEVAMNETVVTSGSPKQPIISPVKRDRKLTDDEFCIIENVIGSGVKPRSSEPRVVVGPDDRKPIRIIDGYFSTSSKRSAACFELPSGYPMPEVRIFVREFSLVWMMYGGGDFGANAAQTKPYSSWSVPSPKIRSRFTEAQRSPYTRGGAQRDHTVLMELELTKVSYLHEIFGSNCPQSSRHLLTVQNVEMRDKLVASQINKFLYQFATEKKPRQTCQPMVCVKLLNYKPHERLEDRQSAECCLKVSLLPLRLNVDQDSLEFLQDFFTDLSNFIEGDSQKRALIKRSSRSFSGTSIRLSECSSGSSLPREANVMEQSMYIGRPSKTETEEDIADPEEEEDSDVDESGDLGLLEDEVMTADQLQPKSPVLELDSPTPSPTATRIPNGLPVLEVAHCDYEDARGQVFFRSFIFTPEVIIKLDYHGKRVTMDQGALQGLLMGLSQLHQTELRLKELHCKQGFLGSNKVVAHAINEWVNDIRKNQLSKIIGGVGPMHCLVQVAQGVRDLFWMPVEEYRRDGHIVKGIQRGAESFTLSTATAALELTQKLVGTVQSVAEFAYDMVNPTYPPRIAYDPYVGGQQPADLREGLALACRTFKEGFRETRDAFNYAAAEERARGKNPVRVMIRQLPPAAITPFVTATQATTQILAGVRNQIQPEARRDDLEKWKVAD